MNEIDNMTLQYFINKGQYDTLLKKNNAQYDKLYASDKKFYKKRIIDMTKQVLKNGIDDKHVQHAFDNYVKTCVNYLKFNDKKEIYQQQYTEMNNDISTVVCDDIHDVSYDNCDFLMYKKQDVKTVNLDNYVKKCQGGPVQPTIMPKKTEINIQSNKYKTKGIVKKKKNITNIYEDKKETPS